VVLILEWEASIVIFCNQLWSISEAFNKLTCDQYQLCKRSSL